MLPMARAPDAAGRRRGMRSNETHSESGCWLLIRIEGRYKRQDLATHDDSI